jgi:Mrp family chromosome partitioning ATPase
MRRFLAWLDTTPLSGVALDLARDATGRQDPLEPLRPQRPVALAARARVAFWSLVGGVGASTTAALVAQRSAGAGLAPVLADLDRWAPSLALRAGIQGATVADALLRPGRERDHLSRWSKVPFLPGAPGLEAMFESARIVELLRHVAGDGALVADLGCGPAALDAGVLALMDHLCVVAGPRSSQLQAAFCSVPLLRDAPCRVGLVLVGVEDADASRISARLPWPCLGSIPADPYLADDGFAARAPTMAAIDRLIKALA